MQSTRRPIGVLATACAVALFGCSKQPGSTTPDAGQRPGQANVTAPQGCPGGLQATDAVVINLSSINPVGATQWHEKTLPGGQQPDNMQIPPPLTPMPGAKTPADVDARPFLKNPSDLLLLQINVPSTSGLTFATDPVDLGSSPNGKMFCTQQPLTGGGTSIIFYVRSFNAKYGSYTLQFNNGKGQIVRIAVDPEVQNNG